LILFVGTISGVVAAQPSVTVEVDGEEVTDGTSVETGSDPELSISVEANTTIEFVEIRVDGQSRERYEPDSESFSETLTLDLKSGEHDVEVVASAEQTTTVELTIVKDSGRPFIEYTNPFETPDRRPPPDSTTVSDAFVDLSGKLIDDTGVETIRIERRFEYRYDDKELSREMYTIEDPGDSFSQELLLGDGINDITARYTDELGNTRRHEFALDVADGTAPTIDLRVPDETGASTVTIKGKISDNVKVQQVTLTANKATRVIVQEESPEPTRDRLSVDVEADVDLVEGENLITVEATDNSGNTETQEYEVVYDRQIVPTTTIDCAQTGFESGEIAVRGSVTQGEIISVTAESVDTETGETIDIASIYGGSRTNSVEIDESLAVAAGKTRVRVIVIDSQEEQHETSFLVNPVTTGVFLDGGAGCAPVTPTATATPTPTPTATATATITGTAPVDDSTETPADADTDGDSGGTAPQAEVETTETPSGSGPGFTLLVTLLALALLAVRLMTADR